MRNNNIFLNVLKAISGVAFIFLFTFFIAGRFDYWQGWIFNAVMIIVLAVIIFLFKDKMDLAQERMRPGPGVKLWDKILFTGFSIFILTVWVVGILDSSRFFWSISLPVWVYAISYLVFLFSIFMFTWPMMVNKWFSSMVRIQKDRGQLVCEEGPYKYVRHPGYIGGILMALSMSLVFGSLWALIPGIAATILLILRTYLEDNTLKNELFGYLEYSKKVKYRLLPGIW